MLRDDASECEIGDWLLMMEAPDWEAADSPVTWKLPSGELAHFGFTCVPVRDDDGEEAGRDFVWMRFDPAAGPPPPPRGVNFFRTAAEPPPPDPADWWKASE